MRDLSFAGMLEFIVSMLWLFVVVLWARRLDDLRSGHSLQVLAEEGCGLSAAVPHAVIHASILFFN